MCHDIIVSQPHHEEVNTRSILLVSEIELQIIVIESQPLQYIGQPINRVNLITVVFRNRMYADNEQY